MAPGGDADVDHAGRHGDLDAGFVRAQYLGAFRPEQHPGDNGAGKAERASVCILANPPSGSRSSRCGPRSNAIPAGFAGTCDIGLVPPRDKLPIGFGVSRSPEHKGIDQ
jgi:hypothetical protein